MKDKFIKYKAFIVNLLFPSLVFGFVTGTLTAIVVTTFKLCAKYVILWSSMGYELIREHLYLLPVFLAGALGISYILARIYKSMPNIKGGGIPTSVAILRGIITFKWLRTLIGVFVLSLTSFLIGVPLGNEGPSVQMGTALGRGSVYTFAKKHRAWDRYSMTGGACAGFSCATGSPISGIIFAIEEAHQRISPTIVLVASSSVVFSNIASSILCPVFGVSERIFEIRNLPSLELKDLWIPLLVGIVVGIFSVAFLFYYRGIDKLHDNVLARVPHFVKIFVIIGLTICFGVISFSFVSTGHQIMADLYENNSSLILLIAILLVRTTLTLSANSSGLTGGTFVPILTLGALVGSILGKVCLYCGLNENLYVIFLVLGLTACVAGSMKMPITAIVFSLEAMSCINNVLPVIITSLVAYLITELFEAKSMNDTVIELRQDFEERKEKITVDTFVTVQKSSFAVDKQIRDIFWPKGLLVLSLQRKGMDEKIDEHGGKELKEGDLLHIRYSTSNENYTKEEIFAIVGEQHLTEQKI